ncbi:hypothetical protein AB6A40_006949 [Gnathostoma spinigerum]|uniref:Uncharacterized protein n=1 Tax=Gnathostoma spinigerum TaxID=75299 RepID=A0ABD6EJT9_9BILA
MALSVASRVRPLRRRPSPSPRTSSPEYLERRQLSSVDFDPSSNARPTHSSHSLSPPPSSHLSPASLVVIRTPMPSQPFAPNFALTLSFLIFSLH